MISIPKYQLSKTTIRQLIEDVSEGTETVIWDNYGYPNIMYIINNDTIQDHFNTKFYETGAIGYDNLTESSRLWGGDTTVTQEILDEAILELDQFPIIDENFVFQRKNSGGVVQNSYTMKTVEVTGTTVPDCSGAYTVAGKYNNTNYFVNGDSSFYLWFNNTVHKWVISTATGSNLATNCWYKTISSTIPNFDGSYTAVTYTGTPTVKFVEDYNHFTIKDGRTLAWGSPDLGHPASVSVSVGDIISVAYRYQFIHGAFVTRTYSSGKYPIVETYENIYISKYRASLTEDNIPVSLPGAMQDIVDLKDCDTTGVISSSMYYDLFPSESSDKVVAKGSGWKVTNSLEMGALRYYRAASIYDNRYRRVSQNRKKLSTSTYFMAVPNYYDAYASEIERIDLLSTMKVKKKSNYNTNKNTSIKLGLKYPTIYDKIVNIGWTIPLDYTNWFDDMGDYSPITPDISGWIADHDTTETLVPNDRIFQVGRTLYDSSANPLMIILDYTEQSDALAEDFGCMSYLVDSTNETALRCRLVVEPLDYFYNIFKDHPYYSTLLNNADPVNKIIDILNSDLTKTYSGIHAPLTKLSVYYTLSDNEVIGVNDLVSATVEFKKDDKITPIGVFLIDKPISGLYEEDPLYDTQYCDDSYSFFNEYAPGIWTKKTFKTCTVGGNPTDVGMVSVNLLIHNPTSSLIKGLNEGTNGYYAASIISTTKSFDYQGNSSSIPYMRYLPSTYARTSLTPTLSESDFLTHVQEVFASDSTTDLYPLTAKTIAESDMVCSTWKGASTMKTFIPLLDNRIIGINRNIFNTYVDADVIPKNFQTTPIDYTENISEGQRNYSNGNPIYSPYLFKNEQEGVRVRNERFYPQYVYEELTEGVATEKPLTMVMVYNSPVGFEFKPIGVDLSRTYIDEEMTILLRDCLINSSDKYANSCIKFTDPYYMGMTGLNNFEITQPDSVAGDDTNGYFYFTKTITDNDYYKFWSPLHECQGLVDIPDTLVTYRMTYFPGNVVNFVSGEIIEE